MRYIDPTGYQMYPQQSLGGATGNPSVLGTAYGNGNRSIFDWYSFYRIKLRINILVRLFRYWLQSNFTYVLQNN